MLLNLIGNEKLMHLLQARLAIGMIMCRPCLEHLTVFHVSQSFIRAQASSAVRLVCYHVTRESGSRSNLALLS